MVFSSLPQSTSASLKNKTHPPRRGYPNTGCRGMSPPLAKSCGPGFQVSDCGVRPTPIQRPRPAKSHTRTRIVANRIAPSNGWSAPMTSGASGSPGQRRTPCSATCTATRGGGRSSRRWQSHYSQLLPPHTRHGVRPLEIASDRDMDLWPRRKYWHPSRWYLYPVLAAYTVQSFD